jgi:hypothetical protein
MSSWPINSLQVGKRDRLSYYRIPRSTTKCGHATSGITCETGPVNGRCSRIGAKSDEASTASTAPCRPIRTLHGWNRIIQTSTTLLVLAVVSLTWSNWSTKSVLAPGPLSSPHAQLLISSQHSVDPNGSRPKSPGRLINEANRCAACHPGQLPNPAWNTTEHLAQSDSVQIHVTQSQLCLDCHLELMPNATLGSPHDLHTNELENMTERSNTVVRNSLVSLSTVHRSIDWKSNPTECSQCHREHQGAMHTLQEMASDRCQACHQNAFQSFSNGHPEFKNYPYARSQRISFDHRRHEELHYAKKSSEFSCKQCHVQADQIGAVGQVFRSLPFEQACASCHSEPTKSAVQDGLVFLQLPSVNAALLQSSQQPIGKWPVQSSQMNDGSIPPIMRWLIEAEHGGPELLGMLPTSSRLSEIDMTDSNQRVALSNLVLMTKTLMNKFANEGQRGLRSSVEKLVSVSSSDSPWLDQIAAGLPPDLFRAAIMEWFPDDMNVASVTISPTTFSPNAKVILSSQIQKVADGDDLLTGDDTDLLNVHNDAPKLTTKPESTTSNRVPFQDPKTWDQLSNGGWMIDRQQMAIVYVPSGHADPWVSRWLELEQSRNPRSASPVSLAQQCRTCHLLGVGPTEIVPLSTGTKPFVAKSNPSPSLWQAAFRKANSVMEDLENTCWQADRRQANERPITRFDHTPHLSLPKLSDCRACHQLNKTMDATAAHHEFQPMAKSQCGSCHQPSAAGENCTQCHNYHVGNHR